MKVLYEKRGEIVWITFNRPEKLNALDKESWSLLSEHLRRANEDKDVRAVVLTGNGRAFSSGDDIHAMYELKSYEEAVDFFDTLFRAVDSLMSLTKPLICLVNGLAYGGGCEILLFCDVTIALKGAKFSIPEGRLGLIPPMAISVGYHALGRAINRLVLTGEEIDAQEAKNIGLVDYVVEDLNEGLNKVVEMISRISPTSVVTMKRWLMRGKREEVEEAVKELTLLSLSEEAKRRMYEFIESRKRKK
ncbi:MAG: enoyl-CoA hydratase/isomerase family protein [Sulfolobaceae archaeon]|nr:enoyl-CoA hydratase/isomerase family protein [Sulfolobaceae archaeon]